MSEGDRDLLSGIIGTVDTKLEEDGAWFEHAPEDGRMGQQLIPGYRHVLLDSKGNGLRRVKVRSRFTKDYQRSERQWSMRAARIPQSERGVFSERMVSELTAKHCVVEWDFTARNGDEIPFDHDTVLTILTDGRFRHHRDFIFIAIARLQGDITEVVEEDQGN